MDDTVYKISFDEDDEVSAKTEKKTPKGSGYTFKIYIIIAIVFFIVLDLGVAVYVSAVRGKSPKPKGLIADILVASRTTPTNAITDVAEKGESENNQDRAQQERMIKDEETEEGIIIDASKRGSGPIQNTGRTQLISPENIKPSGSLLTSSVTTYLYPINAQNKTLLIYPTPTKTYAQLFIVPSPIPTVTPTPTVTLLPSLTPTPTISDPPNIQEIVDNKDTLNGSTVEVVGYLINGNVGAEACLYMFLCEYSTLVVNQEPGFDRDVSYDVTAKISTTESESDYTTGQKIKFTATVIADEFGTVTLEKIY